MREIDYLIPQTLTEALGMLYENRGKARLIAGGTDLVVRLKQDMVREDIIIDISRINELDGIYDKDGSIHILPLSTHTQIIESDLVRHYGFVLWEACKTIGSPQIRNRGTIGGNVGNASPAGDSITALFVHEAKVVITSINGERILDIEDFFLGPGKTALGDDEMITDIFFPKANENEVGFFKKLGQRKGIAISIINVAAKLTYVGNNRFSKAVVSLGAVAPTVVRGRILEKAIVENSLDSPDKLFYISRLAFREVSPISDIRGSVEYRRDMSINLLYEGLLELYNKGWRQ